MHVEPTLQVRFQRFRRPSRLNNTLLVGFPSKLPVKQAEAHFPPQAADPDPKRFGWLIGELFQQDASITSQLWTG